MSEETQVCKKCGKTLPLSEFYNCPTTINGRFGTCKKCKMAYSKNRFDTKKADALWVKKENKKQRERARNKKNKPRTAEQKTIERIKFKARYPEKYAATLACAWLPRDPGCNNHHWSYDQRHHKDVISLSIRQHNLIHRFTVYDQERMMYRRMDGSLIDSREAAIAYYATLKDE